MLIHKAVSALAPFTSTDTHRTAIRKIHINEKECVATDGHCLVIMPNNESEHTDGDYPTSNIKTDVKSVLVPIWELKLAVDYLPKKPTLPILNYIQIGTNDGDKPIISSGLPAVQFPINNTDESFPNYQQVIPDYQNDKPIHFAINARILKKVCDLAIKHGNKFTNKITFEIPTEKTPEHNGIKNLSTAIKFNISDDGQTKFYGLIMPLRVND